MLFLANYCIVIRGAPRHVASALRHVVRTPRCSQRCHRHSKSSRQRTSMPLRWAIQLWDLTPLESWSENSQTLPEAPYKIFTFCRCGTWMFSNSPDVPLMLEGKDLSSPRLSRHHNSLYSQHCTAQNDPHINLFLRSRNGRCERSILFG